MNFVDTHAHLDFTDDKEGWIKRAKENGVGKIICVGTSVDASRKCMEIAEKYSTDDLQIFATVGIHAQDGKNDIEKFGSFDKCVDELRQIAKSSSKVVGVGEAGFDVKSDRDQLPETKELQGRLFEAQIGLAAELKLPLIVHCRNGWEETFELLRKFSTRSNSKLRGLFHSWTGDWETAQKALDLGFYISFSGIVTFKNATDIQNVAKNVPLDRMLVETDSPFLSPEPFRGKTNEPKNVKIIAEFIARLRDLPIDRLADVTSKNAGRLFGI